MITVERDGMVCEDLISSGNFAEIERLALSAVKPVASGQ